jgi:hypothetical protein
MDTPWNDPFVDRSFSWTALWIVPFVDFPCGTFSWTALWALSWTALMGNPYRVLPLWHIVDTLSYRRPHGQPIVFTANTRSTDLSCRDRSTASGF